MKKPIVTALAAIAGIVLLLFLWAMGINNDLVSLHETTKANWSQVDVQLQRRYDLIPKLVETVKGYAAHEKELFESVAQARSQWANAKTTEEKVAAAGILERGLGRLIAVSEAYPELKASENFKNLQFELAGTENRIATERRRYNDSIRAYNTRVRQFPASFVASMRGFAPSDAYFETPTEAREAPKVDFGTREKAAS